ncbi:unnamed protein product [Cylicocyclus nassatus]|uniref:Uncharacterized protein n=1 Tax=Cylicocyclus nassatus TaxID=53992 RepID=A0AA36GR25_CYLNA|nr:unnamed protein product [Cylicocyclus nassatus]
MFSFVPVVLLVAIIARTQALECYYGTRPRPMIKMCAPTVEYCYIEKADYDKYIYLGCDDYSQICKGKGGCRRNGNRSICCCASNLCNA